MSTLFRTHFPYCIQAVSDGYVLLNRAYKPIGFMTNDWTNYDSYPIQFHSSSFNESVVEKLSWKGDAEFPIFIYSDGCAPWTSEENEDAYLGRLKILGRLKSKP
jgi:hypothetical protein